MNQSYIFTTSRVDYPEKYDEHCSTEKIGWPKYNDLKIRVIYRNSMHNKSSLIWCFPSLEDFAFENY